MLSKSFDSAAQRSDKGCETCLGLPFDFENAVACYKRYSRQRLARLSTVGDLLSGNRPQVSPDEQKSQYQSFGTP